MFVRNRMTKNPITVLPTTTIDDVVAKMKLNKIHRLPVVDDGKLVGILTEADISKVTPSQATTLSRHEINSLLSDITAKEVMTKDVKSIGLGATIEEAALLMAQAKINALPVVSEVGAVVGIITDADIFRTFVDIMGLADGKTRITVKVGNQVGVIENIAGIFAAEGLNIDSLVTCKTADGTYEIVIRGDFADVEGIKTKLVARGYDVVHTVRIG